MRKYFKFEHTIDKTWRAFIYKNILMIDLAFNILVNLDNVTLPYIKKYGIDRYRYYA